MPSTQSSTMKQEEMEYDTPFLPEEIIKNILKRLPVRSLIRFQCVCKDWKNLLNAPSFIEDHLHYSTVQNPSILFHGHTLLNPLHLYMLNREMQVLGVQSTPLIEHLQGATIIGSINGLLCVKFNTTFHYMLLWNPAIRKFRLVARGVNFCQTFKLGFGFSSIVNDYKIVSISIVMTNELVYRVEVYSCSKWSWKEIEFGSSLDGVAIRSDGFSTNGAIFWFGFKEGYGHLLVSYYIATEEFTVIPSPISAPELSDSLCNRLSVHENKLAMLSHTTIENFQYSLIDLWVMEEGTGSTSGEKWSWTKKYSIRHPYLLLPGVVWRNIIVCHLDVLSARITASGRKVMDDGLNFVLVNLATNELKRFAFHKYGIGFCVFNYVESLVPVGNSCIEEL